MRSDFELPTTDDKKKSVTQVTLGRSCLPKPAEEQLATPLAKGF